MLSKLKEIEERYVAIDELLTRPEVFGDPAEMRKLSKEQKDISAVVNCYRRYMTAKNSAEEALSMLDGKLDPDFRELCQDELDSAKDDMARLEEELKRLLLPRDPNDDKNVIVEIRGGVGGEEAALFANSLYRMYTMYAETKRWKIEVNNVNETEIGGIKEISFMVIGDGAYSRLKFESGVHRVQRVPETESGGRVHTSAASVAVLPEADNVDIDIAPGDLQIDTYRSSGAGGQHVNKTESAIRITHLPSGLVVECQDERSQYKNKDRAMKILMSKLLEAKQSEQTSQISAERRSMVGSGDRSERIRTYNYSQGRVTDHRIGLTLYKLEAFLDGDIDEMVDALITADEAEKMRAHSEH